MAHHLGIIAWEVMMIMMIMIMMMIVIDRR